MKILLIFFWPIFGLPFTNSDAGKPNGANLKPTIEKKARVLRISQVWLNDLTESYAIGFPHQFGHLKYRNNFTVPNHNVPRDVNNRCQNVTFCSFDQNRRLIDQFGYESALNSAIQEMMDIPRARLFEFEDHWGESQDYHFLRSNRMGMCSDLRAFSRKAKSVTTFGKCVRLFQFLQCRGWSLAVYPGSSHSHRFEVPRHVTFQSIGPCLENEFSGGYLNQTMPGFVTKNPKIRSFQPDLIMFFDHDIDLGYFKVIGEIRFKYLLGPGNRTEIIEAKPRGPPIFSYDPKANVAKEKMFEKSLDKEAGDVLGHAIPTSIGGPANETFNIFTASPFALKMWEDFFLRNFRDNRKIGKFHLQFEYENKHKTRPLFFYYRVFVLAGAVFQIHYGRIINNGHEANLAWDKPYKEAFLKFEYKGTATINFPQVLERYRRIPEIMDSFSSNIFLQSFRITDPPVGKWDTCKHKHFTDLKDLNENVLQTFLLKAQIRGMVNNPMVRVFSGENLTGYSQDYYVGQKTWHFHKHKGCYDMYGFYVRTRTVTSAENFGTCIRLFERGYCKGLSLAIYGRSSNSHRKIDSILNGVESVGPCHEDEFINATFSDKKKGQVVKDLNSSFYFPDKVQFGGFDWVGKIIFSRSIEYGVGPKNRTEYIDSFINRVGPAEFPRALNVEDSEFYKSRDKKVGDVPCYAIPLAINGPSNESFNIFPISQARVEDWARIFPSSFSDPDEELVFQMELRFSYEHGNSTRPHSIYYRFERYSDKRVVGNIYYGRFSNL